MQDKFPYNIVLIGFMGTGKSTISEHLSQRFGMEAVEMDQEIEKRENMTIREIFSKYGEEYFRDLETELLIWLQKKENMVISCGGGVALREQNVQEMKKNGRVVLLDAKPKTVYDRIKDDHNRPLLENHMNVEYIASMMEQRRDKYMAAADLVIAVDGKTTEEIAEELACRLLEAGR